MEMQEESITDEDSSVKMPKKELSGNVEGLLQETVWLKQLQMEELETAFYSLNVEADEEKEDASCDRTLETHPLALESVWLRQLDFEKAETWSQEVLAGTADPTSLVPPHGPPVKRHHDPEKTTNKKMKSDKGLDMKHMKLHNQITSLSKSSEKIRRHLDDFEKTQRRKAQAVGDTMMRLNNAIEACQDRLKEELEQSTFQITCFRSLLKDMDSVIEKTDNILQDRDSGQTKALSSFYQTMSERISKMDSNLNQCIETCSGLHAEVPKSEINRIVGEIGRLSLFKKKHGTERFVQKQEAVSKMLKDLMTEKYCPHSGSSSVVSDMSMEANVSSSQSSDEKDREDFGAAKPVNGEHKKNSGGRKVKPRFPGGIKPTGEGNCNNSQSQTPTKAISQQGGGAKPKTSSGRSEQSSRESFSTPKKRNAQGSQSTGNRKQDVFQFRGASKSSASTPYMQQLGILGPMPHAFGGGSEMNRNQSFSPRFQNASRMAGAMSPSSNVNFNFSQYQQGPSLGRGAQLQARMNAMSMGNQVDASGAISPMSRIRQSKLFQATQAMNYPQGGASVLAGNQAGSSVEQQLNDIAQKLQQMQLVARQDYQVQQLVQETQRLKHMLAQKQVEQHHQDHFQQQFELLINAFLHQQQLQAQQQPKPKMAKSMPTQQQRMFLNKQYQLHQQHKKQKQQHNRSQHSGATFTSPTESRQQASSSTPPGKRSSPQETSPSSTPHSNGATGQSPNKSSKLVRKGLFNPFAQGDKHQAGVSSMVVLEALNCVVLVDIINSCLKLYDVSSDGSSSNSLNHRLVTRLDIPRPFYMARLGTDRVAISRQGNIITVVRVSKRRLELINNVDTNSQYYGLAYVKPGQLACAAFRDNKIDLVTVKDGDRQPNTYTLTDQCKGPELLAGVPGSDQVVYLERKPEETVNLIAISTTSGQQLFCLDLDPRPDAVWNLVCCGDKIICSNKSSHKLKMYSTSGRLLTKLHSPGGTMKQPFAMAFSDQGILYVANDGAWDSDFEHYVTTEINVFGFSQHVQGKSS